MGVLKYLIPIKKHKMKIEEAGLRPMSSILKAILLNYSYIFLRMFTPFY